MESTEIHSMMAAAFQQVADAAAQATRGFEQMRDAFEKFGLLLGSRAAQLTVPGRWMFWCATHLFGMEYFDALEWMDQFPGAFSPAASVKD